MEPPKGNRVRLSTFNSWGKNEIIGKKVVKDNEGSEYVNFVWCLVCTRNKKAILEDKSCKGKMKDSMMMFVEGTNNVTKFAVMRHLTGKAHDISLKTEERKDETDRQDFPSSRLVHSINKFER